ncbi:MAG: hypothetical protein Q9228_002097 [Teloschistes exilis]
MSPNLEANRIFQEHVEDSAPRPNLNMGIQRRQYQGKSEQYSTLELNTSWALRRDTDYTKAPNTPSKSPPAITSWTLPKPKISKWKVRPPNPSSPISPLPPTSFTFLPICLPPSISSPSLSHTSTLTLSPPTGACGGSCACSTCHLIVESPEHYDAMPEPSDDENDMLDLAFGLTETSRLGCQVKMAKEIDGVKVRLPSMTRNMQAGDFSGGKKKEG